MSQEPVFFFGSPKGTRHINVETDFLKGCSDLLVDKLLAHTKRPTHTLKGQALVALQKLSVTSDPHLSDVEPGMWREHTRRQKMGRFDRGQRGEELGVITRVEGRGELLQQRLRRERLSDLGRVEKLRERE